MLPARSELLGVALCLLAVSQSDATSHIFVMSKDGVWVVSDTLWLHNGYGKTTLSKRCKVVITKGRIIFNAGSFRDLQVLHRQEANLPFMDPEDTDRAIAEYLSTNHMNVRDQPGYSNQLSVVNTGYVQVKDGVFVAHMLGQTDQMLEEIHDVRQWNIGQPHGYGQTVSRLKIATKENVPRFADIAAHPQRELEKMMQEETVMRPKEVGPPFTVLLLHADGTVSDYSEHKYCIIPPDAAHKE